MSRLVSLTAISLLFGFVSANAQNAEPPTPEQRLEEKRVEFKRRFPARSDAEEFFLSFHLSPQLNYAFIDKDDRATQRVHNRILLIAWLSNDVGVAYRYSVSETGRVHSDVDIYNWAVQGSSVRELEKVQLKTLQESISRLPISTVRPPINRTVYVSFRDRKDWRTEAYDSTKLPEALESVLKIIGERFETRNRKKSKAN